jgi:hypothetical protein
MPKRNRKSEASAYNQISNVQEKSKKFGKFEFRKSEFVSDFDIRISNFSRYPLIPRQKSEVRIKA